LHEAAALEATVNEQLSVVVPVPRLTTTGPVEVTGAEKVRSISMVAPVEYVPSGVTEVMPVMVGATVAAEKLAVTVILEATLVSVRGFAMGESLQPEKTYPEFGTAVTAVPSEPLLTV